MQVLQEHLGTLSQFRLGVELDWREVKPKLVLRMHKSGRESEGFTPDREMHVG